MKLTSGAPGGWKKISRRRELPLVLVVAGLALSYVSPTARWTLVVSVGAAIVLIALKRWVHAAAVCLLCSGVLLPIAARVAYVSETGGRHDWFMYRWEGGPHGMPRNLPVADPCGPRFLDYQDVPVGPGHLIQSGPLCATIVAFAELHNSLVIAHWPADDCRIGDGPLGDAMARPLGWLGPTVAESIDQHCKGTSLSHAE
jgi:hypothetical protein